METLKFKVIKTNAQYDEYCDELERLVANKGDEDEIELLTLLIETYDHEQNTFENLDPIELLKSLMDDHQLKARDLVQVLGVSKGLVSDILNYKKGLSKEVIRKLAEYFKLNQEAFNRPYSLQVGDSKR